MMIKKCLSLIAMLFLLLIKVFAQENADFETLIGYGFSATEVESLLKGVRLSNLADKEDEIKYMPEQALLNKVGGLVTASESRTFVEALYYLPNLTDRSQLSLLNSLLAIDTLGGLEYYSRHEKRVKALIYSVHVIKEPGKRAILPNLNVMTIPEQLEFYILQNDEKFGEAEYIVSFFSDRDSGLAINIKNVGTLKQGILTIADPEGMDIYLVALPLKEGVLLYGLITNQKKAPGLIKKNMNESLLNRLDAFKGWFIQRYKA